MFRKLRLKLARKNASDEYASMSHSSKGVQGELVQEPSRTTEMRPVAKNELDEGGSASHSAERTGENPVQEESESTKVTKRPTPTKPQMANNDGPTTTNGGSMSHSTEQVESEQSQDESRRMEMKLVANNGSSTSRDTERGEGNPIQKQGTRTLTAMQPRFPLNEDGPDQKTARKTIKLDGGDIIHSVVFLRDGKHVLTGGMDNLIRQWQVNDGKQIGIPMNAGDWANDIAISQDGKRIVSGAGLGFVKEWSLESYFKVGEFEGHTDHVGAVDISPDGTKVASGGNDLTARVWDRSTGEQLLTLQHDESIAAMKFSPNGSLIATATWRRKSVRVYNSEDGSLVVEFPVGAGSYHNKCLAWDHDSKHLYVITDDRSIRYLDISTGRILSRWALRAGDMGTFGCIALPNNHRFIAGTADSSVSFWDCATHVKIGSDINFADIVYAMAISENYDLAIGHGKTVTIHNLRGVLPSSYFDNETTWDVCVDPGETMTSPAIQVEPSMANPEKTVQELRSQLAHLQSRYETQSRELISTKKELGAFKLSNEEKDRTIDGLAARVDQWRRSDAAKAEQLAAAHKELEERRRDSQELVSVREELRFSQSQIIDIRRWYDEQLRELKSIVEESQRTLFPVQNFIAKADTCAENAIVKTLHQLNEHVQRSSVFMAECVLHDFQPRSSGPTEEQSSAVRTLKDFISQSLVNRIRSNSRTDVAAYLPIVLQAYLTQHLSGIISSWSIENGQNQIIREIYRAVRNLESQTISGRWRSVTYAAISPTCSSDPDVVIASTISGLCNVVAAAGCAASASDANAMISSKFRNQISSILVTAGQLTKVIMDALSGDYRVEVVPPAEPFDSSAMEFETGARDDGAGRTMPRSQRVLCTTQLGLSKEVVTQSKVGSNMENTVTVTTVVKAKVLG